MTFGEKIKRLRTDNNLNQEQLAEKLFVTRTAISKWETGKGYPSIDSLKLLSDLFSVSIDELISNDDVECKKLIDDKRARRFYYIAVAFLSITLVSALITFFAHIKWVSVFSLIGVVGYVFCAFLSKPKYKRIEAKKYIVTYVISRIVVLAVVIGVMIYTIAAMD